MFFHERFMVARHEEGCCENTIFTMFSCLRRAIEPDFRRYGGEVVSEPAISLKKSYGGYRSTPLTNFSNTVERATFTSFGRLESPITNKNVPGSSGLHTYPNVYSSQSRQDVDTTAATKHKPRSSERLS